MSEQNLVYVIDDDPSMRDLIRSALQQGGLSAVTFASAEEAIAAGIADNGTSGARCLLLDLEMPGTHGLAFLETLRDKKVV